MIVKEVEPGRRLMLFESWQSLAGKKRPPRRARGSLGKGVPGGEECVLRQLDGLLQAPFLCAADAEEVV